jgi:hypothetical protein
MTPIAVRREFLRRLACLAVAALGPFGPASSNEKLPVGSTGDDVESLLTSILQQLFPHPKIAISHYREVAQAIEAASQDDTALRRLIESGHRQLGTETDVPWLEASQTVQLQVLERLEATPFFQTIRGMGSFLFYNNPAVWPYFGYEGSSFEHGGYINRGFDDLDWLPDPPTQ